MKITFIKTIIVTLALAGSACSSADSAKSIFDLPAVNEGAVIVTVNGTEIHEGFFDTLGKINPRLKAQLDNPLNRKKMLSSIIEQQLLYQSAIDKGLTNDPAVQIRSLFTNHTIVANAYLEKELEDAMKTEFEKRKADQFTRVEMSQIAINAVSEEDFRKGKKPTEEQLNKAMQEANAIKARLDKGEDFAAVAKEVSDDKRTAPRGGAAGQVSKDDKRLARIGMKALAEKAFALKKDQFSDPILAAEGYYIVKVTSDPIVTDFEEAKRVLGFELQNTVKTKLVEDLKKVAKIEYPVTEKMAKPEDSAKPESTATTATSTTTVTTTPSTQKEPKNN